MSRTDKDLPYWMLSIFWEPKHHGCQHAILRRGDRPCDLPADPVLKRPPHWGFSHRVRACLWVPCWDYYDRGYGGRGVPRSYVRLEFTGPERRRVRDELTRARQEYRGTGEVDTMPSTTQHRHMARWLWW